MKSILILLIKGYKFFISPLIHGQYRCRFHPTCSSYALEALHKYKLHTALGLIIRRFLRCNPFGGYGYDPVELNKTKKDI